MIYLNDFRRQWLEIGPDVLAACERVGSSGWYILGAEVKRFEESLARFWGLTHAVGVGNGMDAIEIGLRCLGLQRGQKVLTTPLSAFATTLAIIRAGGIPVFVDVDNNGNIDLEQSRDVIARDESVRFFLPVHLYGNPLDLEALEKLKADYDLHVLEDCAQSIGASFAGRPAGTVGQVLATSFYPTKNLGSLGDGGALLTNDPAVAATARSLRNYGQSNLYAHDEIGLNSRLDELHAAILADAMLPKLRDWQRRREEIASRYAAALSASPLRMLTPAPQARPVWHLFPLFTTSAEERSAFQQKAKASGITTGVHYPRVIPDQPAFRALQCGQVFAESTTARRLTESEVSLPIHPFLEEQEVTAIARLCREWGDHRPTPRGGSDRTCHD